MEPRQWTIFETNNDLMYWRHVEVSSDICESLTSVS